MEDSTKKIMLVTSVLGSLAAVTLGYKYYYSDTNFENSENSENSKTDENEPKYKTLGTILKEKNEILSKGEKTKYRSGFINDMIQTIGFGNKPEKVKIEIKEKNNDNWPTFN